MKKNLIGENAGKVWKALEKHPELTIDELKKKTKLSSNELHLALGWLSREDKIYFFEENNELKMCLTEK